MDKALERARTLYTAVEVALKNHRLDSHEMSGLREIRYVEAYDALPGLQLCV